MHRKKPKAGQASLQPLLPLLYTLQEDNSVKAIVYSGNKAELLQSVVY